MRVAEDRSYELRPGSVYTIRYGKESDSVTGSFRGYTMIGSETAVVIDSSGRIFYIPAAAIACMALVEQAPDEKQHAANDIYYG